MLATAFLLAIAAPGTEPVTSPSIVTASSKRQVALQLAEVVHPKATVQAFSTRAAVDSLAIQFSRDPILIKLERTYPGLRDALLKRAPDVLDPLVESRIPLLYSAMAERLIAEMTEANLRDALAFSEGPEGQALMGSATDLVIKNYLEKGPFSPSDNKKIVADARPPSVKDRRVVFWAKANMLFGPVLLAWQTEQRKIEEQALGDLVEAIVSEMVDREPS